MVEREMYLNCIRDLLKNVEYNFSCIDLPNNYQLNRFFFNYRMIDLIFENHSRLARTYVLNTENSIPDYKDTHKCYTIEMLDLISWTTKRNFDLYFGKNRPDGIYQRTSEQLIMDFIVIFNDNLQVIIGNEWPTKEKIDEQLSLKMGYKTEAGWKPDPHIIGIKNDLEFLLQNGFEIIKDDSELPEYDSFRWEPTVIYYNLLQDTLLEVEVDYRGSCNNMRIGTKLKTGNTIPYDLNLLKSKLKC
jgi:hypothetical protein